jgi:RNA polymerase sigma-70 factor (ECF subfamily)
VEVGGVDAEGRRVHDAGLPGEVRVSVVDANSDEAVERAWRSGAAGGFSELFRRHYRGLVSYLNRFTRDLTAAEDLAQQAFVRLLERREQPAGEALRAAGGRFRALVYTAARNLALNELRRQGRRYVARATIGGAEEPADARGGPLEGLVAAEDLARFHGALAALPDDERAAFELKEVRGLTYAEAGAQLGMHPDAVRRRVAKAFERLRDGLAS